MNLGRKSLILFLSIVSAWSADKDENKFAPGPASSYENAQRVAQVTLAAQAFETDEQTRPAFGKLNPTEHGVLPVLLLIQNDSGQTINLEGMRVEYIRPDRRRIEATPAQDVPYLYGPERPQIRTTPLPRLGRRKNPLAALEIESRAFAARMLPKGESAHGFFYFQTAHSHGSILYVTGIVEAGTGKELFYVEIPLSKAGGGGGARR